MIAKTSTEIGEPAAERLSGAERSFITAIADLLRTTTEGRVPFAIAMASLLDDLKTIRRSDWDVSAVVGPGHTSSVRGVTLPEGTPARIVPTEQQRELLEDIAGLIEFAVRNGVSTLSLFASLTHDLVELSTYGWDLEAAKADGFRPKAAGWAKLSQQPVSESDEVVE